jgi:hypothetical protein
MLEVIPRICSYTSTYSLLFLESLRARLLCASVNSLLAIAAAVLISKAMLKQDIVLQASSCFRALGNQAASGSSSVVDKSLYHLLYPQENLERRH